MSRVLFGLKLVVCLYLAYLLFFLGFSYHPERPGYDPPFVIFLTDTVNLFIHEAGHFFLKPFWRWLEILGGSLFQVLVPLALALVTFRETPHRVMYPGFWLGESLVNVSVYIRDAPYMKLKLIASGLIHDWNYLLGGNTTAAAGIGWTVFGVGIAVAAGSILHGAWSALKSLRQPQVDA